MKKILYIITILSFGLSLGSCDEGWLEVFPSTKTADEAAITSVADGRIAMNGVYDRLRSPNFYGRNAFVCGDAGTEDVVLRTDNSNRFTSTYNWKIQPGDAFVTPIWERGYIAVRAANEILKKLPAIEPKTPAEALEKNQVLGEAYFTRALIHFELVKFFAQAYNFTSDASHLGVPYVLEPSIETNVPRKTVKEVFDYIIADLESAVNSMNVDVPSTPYSAGKLAVKALLARVYLYKACTNNAAEISKAGSYAEEVITAGRYTVATASQYRIVTDNPTAALKDQVFSSALWLPSSGFSSESIFTLPFSSTERNYTDHLSKIYLDKNRGYGDLLPSEEFRALIATDANDVRSSLFYATPDGKTGIRKFIGPADNWDLCNINIIRISEMYLIAAEAYVRGASKDEAKAKQYVNTIRTNRGLSPLTSDGQTLVNDILTERRKELCFEGFRLSDHKRLNQSIVRGNDTQNPNNKDYGLAYPNYLFASPVSDSELNANNLMVQNEGY